MRPHPLAKYGLLLALVAFTAWAREPHAKITLRTLEVSEHPGKEAEPIYVAGQVVTALRFEKAVDPQKTTLLAWEGRFEPPLVGGRTVVLEPVRDLDADEAVPLRVTLVDGTEFAFLVRRPSHGEGWIDHQVNVFRDPGSFDAVLSSLYDSLKREHELSDENERLKKEENSVDHAFATLLLNGQVKKTPFTRKAIYRLKNEDMAMVVEVLSGSGKVAALINLKNTDHGDTWRFEEAYLTHDLTSYTARSFALRMDRSELVAGQSGTIAVVVDKAAFQTDQGRIEDLTLQIFREDGLLQVAVMLDHTFIQN